MSRYLFIVLSASDVSFMQRTNVLPRQFHSATILMARQTKKIATPSKKQLAAKARKKAMKARKSIFDSEKMTLADAIAVLRAGLLPCVTPFCYLHFF